MEKTMTDVVNEFKSLINMHLSEINRRYNTTCSCDWCAFIVDILINENLNIKLSRSCTETRRILNQNANFISVNKNDALKVGDIILYDWDNSGDCDHIGIIGKIENNTVYTLEGNVKDTDFTKSVVSEMVYDAYRRDKTTSVFRHVDYDERNYSFTPYMTMSKCSLHGGVKSDKFIAQSILHVLGYYNGLIDGVFGNKTVEAIKTFQKKHDICVTGVIDCETWVEMFSTI